MIVVTAASMEDVVADTEVVMDAVERLVLDGLAAALDWFLSFGLQERYCVVCSPSASSIIAS